MKLPHLNNREQLLLAVTFCVIFCGAYAGLRYVPANRAIAELRQAAEATEKRAQTTIIPDEPAEDGEHLAAQLAEQEQIVNLLKTQTETVERRMAPTDSQLAIVDISHTARRAQVNIRINEAYQTPSNVVVAVGQAVSQKKSKKNRPANPASTPAPSTAEATILPASAGWIARMSPGSAFARPLRRLEVKGSYLALNRFIHDLEALPFHVAVLRISVEKMPVLSMPGYPQGLLAELVLAL